VAKNTKIAGLQIFFRDFPGEITNLPGRTARTAHRRRTDGGNSRGGVYDPSDPRSGHTISAIPTGLRPSFILLPSSFSFPPSRVQKITYLFCQKTLTRIFTQLKPDAKGW
jgi:hypothetical protein